MDPEESLIGGSLLQLSTSETVEALAISASTTRLFIRPLRRPRSRATEPLTGSFLPQVCQSHDRVFATREAQATEEVDICFVLFCQDQRKEGHDQVSASAPPRPLPPPLPPRVATDRTSERKRRKYADFVSLSSRMQGVERALKPLRAPLEESAELTKGPVVFSYSAGVIRTVMGGPTLIEETRPLEPAKDHN